MLGRFLLVTEQYRDALEVVNPIFQKNPRDAALLEVVGRAQFALKNNEAAIGAFRTLTELQPQASTAHRYLAEAYANSGNLDLALPEAKQAVELDSKDVEAKMLLARIYLTTHSYAEAAKVASQLAADRPTDARVAELEGTIAMAQGRPQDAVTAYQRGLSLADNNFFRARLAQAQSQAGHPEEAEKTLMPWIESHPDDAVARLAMGDIFLAANRTADAEAQYTAILQKNPDNAIAENNLAWALSQSGQAAEALKHARHAAELAPNSLQVLDTFGVVLLKNDKPQDAVETLNKALDQAPNTNPEVRFHLAQALVAAGRKDDARNGLRTLLELRHDI